MGDSSIITKGILPHKSFITLHAVFITSEASYQ